MDSSDYVARRMLFEICDIITPLEGRFEPIYEDLHDWMHRYTQEYGGDIFHRLPSCKTSRDELLNDVSRLYAGIFARMSDAHSITTLHSLFTISFYMMMKYKEQPTMCGDIVYYFRVISRRLESWNTFNNDDTWQMSILLQDRTVETFVQQNVYLQQHF